MIRIAPLVVFFAPFVLSDEAGLLPEPCGIQDIDCLSRSTEQFLEKTCKGIPSFDIRAIDPLIIPSLDYEVDKNTGLVIRFKNVNVTGLRNQKISDFQMDVNAKSVLLKTKADVHLFGDVTIEYIKDAKSFSGIYSAIASVVGTARYNYNLYTNDKGEEHFEVGPETITCETTEEPIIILNDELKNTLRNDPIVKAKTTTQDITATKENIGKQTICRIVEEAYVSVVHNIRASAKIVPKSAFFKNI